MQKSKKIATAVQQKKQENRFLTDTNRLSNYIIFKYL